MSGAATYKIKPINMGKTILKRDSTSIINYLKEINKLKQLTKEEEIALAKKAIKGDKDAYNQLIYSNLKLVIHIAKYYEDQGLTMEDLIAEGNIGLMKAAELYDPTKNIKFSSFAYSRIRQYMIYAINEHARVVRLPINKIYDWTRITNFCSTFINVHNRHPQLEEIAEQLSLKYDDIIYFISNDNSMYYSLDEYVTDSDNLTVGDSLLDTTKEILNVSYSPPEAFHQTSLQYDVTTLLGTLSTKEQYIVVKFFGLDHTEPSSLETLAAELKITVNTVRDIKEKAIKKLRHEQRCGFLRKYLG
jgi:RNA polymerase primary sigma factor